MRNWAYVYALLSNPTESDLKPDQVSVVPIPVGEGNQSYSTHGGWNSFINADSDKQEEAWEFMKFMTSPSSCRRTRLRGGGCPSGGASTRIGRSSLGEGPRTGRVEACARLDALIHCFTHVRMV
jgi:hypothetical protein